MRALRLSLMLLAVTSAAAWSGAEPVMAQVCPPVPELSLCRAEAGDVRAQLYLGLNAYWSGTRSGEMAPAIHWLRLAAENGSVPAMRLLGQVYEAGYGRRFDRGAAQYWYGRAADAGDEPARAALQRLTRQGQDLQDTKGK